MSHSVLLTGATGFLGSHLLEALIGQNYSVSILKRSTSDTWRIKHLLKYVKLYDIDSTTLEQPFRDKNINTVIHTACNYGKKGESIYSILSTNLMLGIDLFEIASKFEASLFINTDTLQQKQLNAYTLSKQQFTEWLKINKSRIKIANLKLEYFYGPKDDTNKFLPWLIQQFKQNKLEIKLTSGYQKREPIFISDVIQAFFALLNTPKMINSYADYEVGSGNPIEFKYFVILTKEIYESYYGKVNSLLNFGAIPYRDDEAMTISANTESIKKLGWLTTTSLADGLKQTIETL